MTYQQLLESIPPSGIGRGCHSYLMKVANAGVKAGLSRSEIFDDMRLAIDDDARPVSDKEILDTIDKAIADKGMTPPDRRGGYAVLPAFDGKEAVSILTKKAPVEKPEAITEMGQDIPHSPEEQNWLFLTECYEPESLLFFGDDESSGNSRTIRTAVEWAREFTGEGVYAPKFIINPLDGEAHPRKVGEGTTKRGDGNVSEYRYCLFEADALDLKTQLKLWWTIIHNDLLDVQALTYSGKKSLHALIRLGEVEDWTQEIRNDFYPRILIPLGADPACRNPARLSRTPGYRRDGKVQKLVYLKKGKQ